MLRSRILIDTLLQRYFFPQFDNKGKHFENQFPQNGIGFEKKCGKYTKGLLHP